MKGWVLYSKGQNELGDADYSIKRLLEESKENNMDILPEVSRRSCIVAVGFGLDSAAEPPFD